MGTGKSFEEAFAKSQISTNMEIPFGGNAFISVKDEDKKNIEEIAKKLIKNGFKLIATGGTQSYL